MINLPENFADILKKIFSVLRYVLCNLRQQLFVSCGSQTFIAVSTEVH